MDVASAEITKYAANAMLAIRISFMNAVSSLCDVVGADVDLVRRGIGSDPRIGSSFLYAGAGYGGSCFPKDVRALESTAAKHGLDFGLLTEVERINDRQKLIAVEKAAALLELDDPQDFRGISVAIWGLAFKPNTDDIREAPALIVINELQQRGATVRLYDPVATYPYDDDVVVCSDAYDAATAVDLVMLLTEWGEFRNPDSARLASIVRRKLIVDARNVLDATELKHEGFSVASIGTTDAVSGPKADPVTSSEVAEYLGHRRFVDRRCRRSGLSRFKLHAPDHRSRMQCPVRRRCFDGPLGERAGDVRDRFPERIIAIEHDIRKPVITVASDALRERGITTGIAAVCNLASPASPPAYLARPIDTLEIGSLGTQNLLGSGPGTQCPFPSGIDQRDLRRPARAPAARVVLGQREFDRTTVGVRRSEALRRGALLRLRTRTRGLDLRLVRIFNTYGPRRCRPTTVAWSRTSSIRRWPTNH